MSNKLSKGDTLDKDQEARDKAWLATLKPSQHFAPGTYIMRKNVRGLVMAVGVSEGETKMRVQWDDGSMSIIKPIALNR